MPFGDHHILQHRQIDRVAGEAGVQIALHAAAHAFEDAEIGIRCCGVQIGGDAGEITPLIAVRRCEGEWDETGARRHDAQAELFGGGKPELALANPIAAELSDMRPSLIPGLVAAAQRSQ